MFSSAKFEIFHQSKPYATKMDFITVLPDILEYYYLSYLPEELNTYLTTVFKKLDPKKVQSSDFTDQVKHYCEKINLTYQKTLDQSIDISSYLEKRLLHYPPILFLKENKSLVGVAI